MEVTSDGKWFWVEPPDGPVAEAARRILTMRMESVQRFLPLAAHHAADDVEYVHQLRVNCRRASAAQRAFEELSGGGNRRLKTWLKRLRRAAGPARDADVFVSRLRADLDPTNEYAGQLVAALEQSRHEAQDALEKVAKKAAGGGLSRAIERRLKGIAESSDRAAGQSFAEFAARAVGEAAVGLDVVDARTASIADLHQLRIAAKRLRYAIEIFHSAADPVLRTEAYPQVEEMQEKLGAINDRLTSQLRLQQWLGRLPANSMAGYVAMLVVSENSDAHRLRDEFLAWWTPQREATLCAQLAAFG
jgi:CHAD domain-containing protein